LHLQIISSLRCPLLQQSREGSSIWYSELWKSQFQQPHPDWIGCSPETDIGMNRSIEHSFRQFVGVHFCLDVRSTILFDELFHDGLVQGGLILVAYREMSSQSTRTVRHGSIRMRANPFAVNAHDMRDFFGWVNCLKKMRPVRRRLRSFKSKLESLPLFL